MTQEKTHRSGFILTKDKTYEAAGASGAGVSGAGAAGTGVFSPSSKRFNMGKMGEEVNLL